MKKMLFVALALVCSFFVMFVACLIVFEDDMLLFSASYMRFGGFFFSLEYMFYRFMSSVALIPYIELFIIAIFALIYAIPSFIAIARNHKDMLKILLLNIFLGWSVLGWIVALIWSLRSDFTAKITDIKERIVL